MRSRTGVAGAVPVGHAVGHVGGGPDRFARHDDEAVVERVGVDGDPSRPSRTSNGTRLAAVLDRAPSRRRPGPASRVRRKHERPVGVVLELGLGVDAAGRSAT